MTELRSEFREIYQRLRDGRGDFDLFALVLPDEPRARWDLVVSAGWLEESLAGYRIIIDAIFRQFPGGCRSGSGTRSSSRRVTPSCAALLRPAVGARVTRLTSWPTSRSTALRYAGRGCLRRLFRSADRPVGAGELDAHVRRQRKPSAETTP